MALRDILMLAGTGSEAAQNYGLWISGVCRASLTAAAPIIEPSLPLYLATEFPDDLLTDIQEDAEVAADKALRECAEAAQQAGIAIDTLSFKAVAGRVGDAVSRIARCFDATILQQPDPGGIDTSDIVEATLLGSGHPLILVPYIGARHEIGTILVAWDGGESIARAVADAMPLLSIARHVQIVTIGNTRTEDSRLAGDALSRHLGRHGIESVPRRIPGGDIDVANMLLSHAADSGANLLVMGGYGHARLREIVLGGTTREILRSMTVPVMMSH